MKMAVTQKFLQAQCAVLCYGYIPDIAESKITSEAANQFHFVNPLQQLFYE